MMSFGRLRGSLVVEIDETSEALEPPCRPHARSG